MKRCTYCGRENEFLKERLVKDEWINTLSFAMLAEEFRLPQPDPEPPALPLPESAPPVQRQPPAL